MHPPTFFFHCNQNVAEMQNFSGLSGLGKVCKMEGVTILKAATLPEHVHMYVSIPPKLNVSKTIGRIKGKSALIIFDRHPEYRNNRHFWARGYYCETVGNVNEETIKQYIQEQYERDRLEGDSEK